MMLVPCVVEKGWRIDMNRSFPDPVRTTRQMAGLPAYVGDPAGAERQSRAIYSKLSVVI